jgi:hypothetical protein
MAEPTELVTQPEPRSVLLILYANGDVAAPEAKTYGDVLARLAACARAAEEIQQRLANTPLPEIVK